jgi:hypothetical protein
MNNWKRFRARAEITCTFFLAGAGTLLRYPSLAVFALRRVGCLAAYPAPTAKMHNLFLRGPMVSAQEKTDNTVQRFLIIAGIVLLAAGLFWPWVSRFPFGRLPGDINIVREGFSFHFPLMTGVLISLVITLLLWIFRR